jgi:hypothetical protein
MPTTDSLDSQIRAMVTELIESTPQAPVLPELETREAPRAHRRDRRQLRPPSRPLALVSLGCLVLAGVLIAVLLLSAVGRRPANEAGAAQLRQIARNAANQASQPLARGQWLLTEDRASFSAQVLQVGSTLTPAARATVSATIKEWSDDSGESCALATSSPARFASPNNEAAWTRAGLLDRPVTQPVASCSSVEGATDTNGLGQGVGVINVSGLPTDPPTLASELTSGTTGIPGLDQITSHGQNAAFERAAILLIGPTTGTTPIFNAALFDALALMPGIHSLGEVTTHSAVSGLGFAGSSPIGRSVIIVDKRTGALLEARNIEDQSAFAGFESAYVAPPPTPSIRTEGGDSRVIIQWLDPVGSPSVVGAETLPPGANLLPPVRDTGAIAAFAKAGVSHDRISALLARLRTRFGAPASSEYASPALGHTSHSGSAHLQWSFTGPESQVNEYAVALRGSGLFSSIEVHDGSPSS